MSSKSQKDGKKLTQNQFVTSRCVAVVFKKKEKPQKGETVTDNLADCETFENTHTDLQTISSDTGNAHMFNAKLTARKDYFDAKQVFSEFKLRNKTCYWNPALVDSVNSLEYAGFIEPFTILVKGDDIHLENLRTAWGRRVLKDPANYQIERIGDVNGIEMQVIPQTQFIPLPEALCLLIMDLNNCQIVATLDTICERLKFCYQGLHLPSNQHVYDTLGQLIRERKVFHTGCGYFVVTPDTFRMHGDEIQTGSLLSPWTHLHPMYIPAAFSQPTRQPMRSISCQVDAEDSKASQKESWDTLYKRDINTNEKLQIDLPSPRVHRSMSVSIRRPRDRARRDEASDVASVKRSSSAKGRAEKSKSLTKEEIKKDSKTVKTKEKVSLFSKIFGRNKKKQAAVENSKPPVEYATFSAQFPPPEWTWYQQQLDKQLRTETWVQQQIVKSGTWHYLQSMTGGSPTTSLCMGANSLPDRANTISNTQNLQSLNQNYGNSVARRSNKKSHKHKDRLPIVIANNPGEGTHIDLDQKHTYRNSMGQTNIRLSSLPTRVSPSSETLHSNYVSHPLFSSTPRFHSIPERQRIDEESQQIPDDLRNAPERERSRSQRKVPKSKRRTHQDRHSSYTPLTRHISGMSARTAAEIDNDISFEFQGQLPNKHSGIGKSHSSGVNCMGLEPEPTPVSSTPVSSHKYQRSNSYRHTVMPNHTEPSQGQTKDAKHQRSYSYRHTVKGTESAVRNDVTGHIYANIHISDESKPRIPERLHRRSEDVRPAQQPEELKYASSHMTHYRIDLPESDRHSDHGSDHGQSEHTSSSGGGTLTSDSSHEPVSQDSAVEGTEGSEHSTVIDTRLIANKHMERLAAQAKELTLGDSGFSSPRVSENSNESKRGEKNSTKGHNGFMCNNLKEGQKLNNSLGQLDNCSDDSYDRIASDRLYENVRLSHKEVLNNMQYLHKEINVSSQNLNVQSSTAVESLPTSQTEFDPKHAITKKFNFNGDFHVVGVV